MSDLHLALLGTPQVKLGGRVCTFPTRKTLALFIYLCVDGGQHTRDRLTAVFWPESNARKSRAALRRSLALLREVLGESDRLPSRHPAGMPLPVPYLLVEGDQLSFDVSAGATLDVHEVQTAWQQLTRLSTAPDGVEPALLLAQAAVNCYRGDFLAGFTLPDAPEFDEWAGLQRELWHRRLDTIFGRLSQWQAQRGETRQALETAARWVAHDPLSEAANQRLMQAHLAQGDRARALHVFKSYQDLLADELGTTPSPSIETLAARIRMQAAPTHPARAQPITESPGPAVEASWVGRAAEHAQLATAYYAAQQNRMQVTLLRGEAGIGKTRLAREFLSWAAAQGADVLVGRAFEAGGRLPYQPLIDALRPRLERENAPDDLLGDIWLAQLVRIFPELYDRYPDLPQPPSDDFEARTRLFEALVRLVQALAQRTPVVWFIDDLQWADVASLDLLHYGIRSWGDPEAGVRLMLLFAVRDEALTVRTDAPAGNVLARWLANLMHDISVHTVRLEPLTAEDTEQWVRVLSAPTAAALPETRDFARWLFGETSGQPLYIVEIIKALLEQGVLRSGGQAGGRQIIYFPQVVMSTPDSRPFRRGFVPPGVREVIRARLTHLNGYALAILTAGAVLGRNFDFDQLCGVADLQEADALPALELLVDTHLLYEDSQSTVLDSLPIFNFTHDKIRAVIYVEATETRRRILHRRALAILQARGASAADLSYHALAAAMPHESFRYLLAAGDEAMQFYADRDAIEYYEQARRLAVVEPTSANLETRTAVFSHLFMQLGRTYELENEWAKAEGVYQELLSHSRTIGDPRAECMALNRLATLAVHHAYDIKKASSYLEQALAVAGQSDDRIGLAEVTWCLAQNEIYKSDPAGALAYGLQALALAQELDSPQLIARALNVVAFAESGVGKWQDAEIHASEGQILSISLGNRVMEADCLNLVSQACLNLGRPLEAIDIARASLFDQRHH